MPGWKYPVQENSHIQDGSEFGGQVKSSNFKIRLEEYNSTPPAILLKGSRAKHGNWERIEGFLVGEHHLKAKQDIQSAEFHVLNGIYLDGFPANLNLRNEPWNIHIKQVENYSEIYSYFRQTGGRALSHVITVRKENDETFNLDDVIDLKENLSVFLSLCYARKVSISIINGKVESGDIVQRKWFSVFPDTNPFSSSWFHNSLEIDAQELYSKFTSAWNSDAEFTNRLINWYVECAALNTSSENSIILGQAALESIFHKIFVIEKGIFKNNEGYEKLIASDRIRLLLDHLGLDLGIPDKCTHLLQTAQSLQWYDAAHALTDIRNKIVHPGKIHKIQTLTSRHFGEVVDIILFYLELSILRILEYQGKYSNRLEISRNNTSVPWNLTERRLT